jgi:hypothetical protein
VCRTALSLKHLRREPRTKMRERVRWAEGGEGRKRRRSLFVFNDTIAELFNLGYRQQEKRLVGGRRVSRRRYQWRMRKGTSVSLSHTHSLLLNPKHA